MTIIWRHLKLRSILIHWTNAKIVWCIFDSQTKFILNRSLLLRFFRTKTSISNVDKSKENNGEKEYLTNIQRRKKKCSFSHGTCHAKEICSFPLVYLNEIEFLPKTRARGRWPYTFSHLQNGNWFSNDAHTPVHCRSMIILASINAYIHEWVTF